jgi:DNA-binding LacI/PurR family transcriptional regulator
LRIPDDVKLVSFEMNRYNIVSYPGICGMSFDSEKIGVDLAEMILKRIETEKSFPAELTEGVFTQVYYGVKLNSLGFLKDDSKIKSERAR